VGVGVGVGVSEGVGVGTSVLAAGELQPVKRKDSASTRVSTAKAVFEKMDFFMSILRSFIGIIENVTQKIRFVKGFCQKEKTSAASAEALVGKMRKAS
jgi:hypothetical protein